MRDCKGVTLLSLGITIIVLMILTSTFVYNIDVYSENKNREEIRTDLHAITEKVEHYYAKYKQLPILNKYTNLENLVNVTSENDNQNYYVVDLDKIGGVEGLSLNYGVEGYEEIKTIEITQPIDDITDVFIVNEQSHIIYYPEGVEAGEEVIYTITEEISEIEESMYNEIKKVNAPKINEEEGMKLVTFDTTTKTWVEDVTKSDYDYIAGEGTEDNTQSKWANAVVTKDGVDSYFVWIPRYAYRITYYTDKTKTQVSSTNVGYGSIDVKFIKGIGTIAADGTVCKYADDETLAEGDYIIHPAFTSNADLGGGFGELAGLWVGKFETSRSDADASGVGSSTTLKVAPSVKSWSGIKIGQMYSYAKAYNTNLYSHMTKNSEWTAVAYLAYSKYGRNGNEIGVNQCSDYITGAGPGEGQNNIYNNTYAYSATEFASKYSYLSEQGKKASTTGNEYGIYDLSGGIDEYVAVYYNDSSQLSNGSAFSGLNKPSNEYATAYSSKISSGDYKVDAIYETKGWNLDYFIFLDLKFPFFRRGGYYKDTDTAGIFYYNHSLGYESESYSFRTVLIVK